MHKISFYYLFLYNVVSIIIHCTQLLSMRTMWWGYNGQRCHRQLFVRASTCTRGKEENTCEMKPVILSVVILLALVQSIGATVPVPSPTPTSLVPTPTPVLPLAELQQHAVSVLLVDTASSEWTAVRDTFNEIIAAEATLYCSANIGNCNLDSSVNFTSTHIRILPGYPLEITGPILQLLLAVDIPSGAAASPPELIPQNQVVNILLGATSTLQTTLGKIVAGITPYTIPQPSTALLLPVPTVPPTTSTTPTVVTPTPLPPAPSPPTTQEQAQNAIIVILGHTTLEEWNLGQLEQAFKHTVAEQATLHCRSGPTACGIRLTMTRKQRRDSATLEFNADHVLILPGYPQDIADSLEVAFALRLPDDVAVADLSKPALVPQSALLTIGLDMTVPLAERTGVYVVGISAYESPSPSTSDNIPLILGTVIPSVLLLLGFTAVSVWLIAMTLRARKAKARYDLTNYMATDDPDVELISHTKLPWGTTFEDIVEPTDQ